MRYFIVHYSFRPGLNGNPIMKSTEVAFDDIDPETTDDQLKRMAAIEVDQHFERSGDFPLYGKFWEVIEVEEVYY